MRGSTRGLAACKAAGLMPWRWAMRLKFSPEATRWVRWAVWGRWVSVDVCGVRGEEGGGCVARALRAPAGATAASGWGGVSATGALGAGAGTGTGAGAGAGGV